jgi:hypothetical protein
MKNTVHCGQYCVPCCNNAPCRRREAAENAPFRKAAENTPLRKAAENTPFRKAAENTLFLSARTRPLAGPVSRSQERRNDSKSRVEMVKWFDDQTDGQMSVRRPARHQGREEDGRSVSISCLSFYQRRSDSMTIILTVEDGQI